MIPALLPLLAFAGQVSAKLIIYANPTELFPDVPTVFQVADDSGVDLISADWTFDEPHIQFVEGEDVHLPTITVRLHNYSGSSKLAIIRVKTKAVDGSESSSLAGVNIVGHSPSTASSVSTSTEPITTTVTTTTPDAHVSIIGPDRLRFETPTKFIAETWNSACEKDRSWSWECISPRGGLLDSGLSQPSDTSLVFYLKKSNTCERAIIYHACKGDHGLSFVHTPEIVVDHV